MNSGYWQDKAPPLPGTTSGSNGKRVPVDEHEFRHFGKNGFSGPRTLTITSIKTIDKECTVHQISD
jgi:hypothetical protein